jgi:hypothetical protein
MCRWLRSNRPDAILRVMVRVGLHRCVAAVVGVQACGGPVVLSVRLGAAGGPWRGVRSRVVAAAVSRRRSGVLTGARRCSG